MSNENFRNLYKKFILFVLIIMASSCVSYHGFVGKTYEESRPDVYVSITFINDTLCRVTQKFLCSDVPEKYKNTTFLARYKVEKYKAVCKDYKYSMRIPIKKHTKKLKFAFITINNLECPECKNTTEIPNYEDLNCMSASKNDSIKKYHPHGIIYNMVNEWILYFDYKLSFGSYELKLKKNTH